MVMDEAIKTKGKVFVFLKEKTSGFVSDGTWFPPTFDFGEMNFADSGDLKTAWEDLEPEWHKVAELVDGKQRLIKFLFGSEGEYIYYHGTGETVLGGK